jgi:hypothetical protein
VHSSLSVAGVGISLRGGDGVQWTIEEPMTRFLAPLDRPEVEISVRIGAPPPMAAPQLLFDSGAVWRLYRDNQQYRIECRSESFGTEPYKIAIFDASFTVGSIFMSEHVAGMNPLDYPLDEVLLSNLLGRGRGVEIHSCGVIDSRGWGHLFAGVSGAGKTTMARLWEGNASGIVSDDRVIVRERDGAMWMFGTPWHGEAELSMPKGAPLAGVYLLTQAKETRLVALDPAEAVARLFRCAFPLFYDAAAIEFTLGFLERLATAVPVRELQFVPERSVVDLILRDAP